VLSNYIVLTDSLGRPLAVSHLAESVCHLFRIAINAVVGASGAAVDGLDSPLAGAIVHFSLVNFSIHLKRPPVLLNLKKNGQPHHCELPIL
jgi:hypothetical protein